MKDILDHLNDMFDSVYDSFTGARRDSGDPLFDQAWQDLDQFLKKDPQATPQQFRDMDKDFAAFDRQFNTGGANFEDLKRQARSQQSQQNQSQQDPLEKLARELVRDYHNLDVKPGASLDEVKSAYKSMIKQYHPDRFANDPEKQKTATAITSKLNQSYARIMEHLGAK